MSEIFRTSPNKSTNKFEQGNIKTHVMLILATTSIGFFLSDRVLNPPNDPKFSDIDIQTITETNTLLQPTDISNEHFEQYHQQMEKFDQMSVEQFEAQPLQDRLAFARYLIEQADQNNKYDAYYGLGTNRHRERTVLSPENVESDDWIIVETYLHKLQLLMLSSKQRLDGKVELDKDNCIKMLSGILYTTNNHRTPIYDEMSNDIKSIDEPGVIETFYKTLGASKLMIGDRISDGRSDKITYREMSLFSTEGTSYDARFILVNYINYDGREESVWLMDAIDKGKKNYNQ